MKIGLLQSSTNHEAAFSNYDYSRNIPCLTYLITWFDSIDFSGGVDQYDQIELNGQLRFRSENVDFRAISSSDRPSLTISNRIEDGFISNFGQIPLKTIKISWMVPTLFIYRKLRVDQLVKCQVGYEISFYSDLLSDW